MTITMDRIHGYIDSVTAQAIQGWIVNADMPHRLERIVCRGTYGSSIAFTPFLPRLDVCDAFGLRGRFGFAIPTVAIRALGSIVSFTDCSGVVLERGEHVRIPKPDVSTPSSSTWVFLHIQKTAGTSLRSALSSATEPGETVFLYPDGYTGLLQQELCELTLVQRAALRLVMGHTYFGIDEMLPRKAEYITFLREPEARLRSHYLHHLNSRSTLFVDGSPMDISTVVQNGLTDEFDNLMVRMLAGASPQARPIGQVDEQLVFRALHHIRTRFRFVGLTEKSEEHYRLLCRSIGFEMRPLAIENVGHSDQGSTAPPLDWDKIMQRNRFDTMLYDRIQAEGLCGHDLSASNQLMGNTDHV